MVELAIGKDGKSGTPRRSGPSAKGAFRLKDLACADGRRPLEVFGTGVLIATRVT